LAPSSDGIGLIAWRGREQKQMLNTTILELLWYLQLAKVLNNWLANKLKEGLEHRT
jgi:hypothetical protein